MRILVVAAHPDDEVLGCGATLALHAQKGDEVHTLILAEGVTSRDVRRDPGLRSKETETLAESARSANDILGVTALNMHSFPDNRMDSVDLLDIIKVIEDHLNNIRPEIVYSHHAGDVNIDHSLVHRAVVTACRPTPLHYIKTLLFFEIVSSTEWQVPNSAPGFTPNWFVDVSDTLRVKINALRAYQSEMRSWPHARSFEAIEHLAKWRGATVGVDAAEAFILGRNLYK